MNDQVPHPLTPQDCLVAVMIAVSASDEQIRTAELVKIESAVNNLPIFGSYDVDRMNVMAQTVFDLFSVEDGLDALLTIPDVPLEAETEAARDDRTLRMRTKSVKFLVAEAQSLRHKRAHYPHNPDCAICLRAHMRQMISCA